MARGITEKNVWDACDALLLEGARPTIERVRQKIGSGSPNTVSPLLDTWFRHLGRRISDPGAFSVPPDVPETILQAAKHFWEVAQTETRHDFDERLAAGLASAASNVEAEKDRADQASAAAFDAVSKSAQMQAQLNDLAERLENVQRQFAAERARLEEVRTAKAAAENRLSVQEVRAAEASVELRRQLQSADDRAEAADRRVALELERERVARAKAERHTEALQKRLETELRVADELKTELSTIAAELAVERQRVAELHSAKKASAAEASAVAVQVTTLQSSLDRLTTLMETERRHSASTPGRKKQKTIARTLE